MATFTALMLTPREQEKLIVYQVAELARKRKERGVKLNLPESIALISEAILEAARDGKTLDEATTIGQRVLKRADVMEAVPDLISMVQIEATFKDGTALVSCANPICQ